MRSRCLTLTLTALLAALAPACQRPEPATPAATLAQAAPTDLAEPAPTQPATPTPTPPPPPVDYSVPEVIDAAYAERVLEALYALESEAVREIMRADAMTERAEALIRAAYYPPEQADFRVQSYRDRAPDVGRNVRENPGNQGFNVERVLVARVSCSYIAGERDYSLVLESPTEREGLTYVQLLPKVGEGDPQNLNPTPWMIGGSEYRPDGSVPEDPCVDW